MVCRVDSLRGWWKVVQRQDVWKGVGERRCGGNTCTPWMWVLFSLNFTVVKLGSCRVLSV